jgi:hypothetical protein
VWAKFQLLSNPLRLSSADDMQAKVRTVMSHWGAIITNRYDMESIDLGQHRPGKFGGSGRENSQEDLTVAICQ